MRSVTTFQQIHTKDEFIWKGMKGGKQGYQFKHSHVQCSMDRAEKPKSLAGNFCIPVHFQPRVRQMGFPQRTHWCQTPGKHGQLIPNSCPDLSNLVSPGIVPAQQINLAIVLYSVPLSHLSLTWREVKDAEDLFNSQIEDSV